MTILITAFPIDKRDGAGWVSKRLGEREKFSAVTAREESFLSKSLWSAVGILIFPFLHPIFSRYAPIFLRQDYFTEDIWLNFSQTFAVCLLNKNCVLVCHDLQCHCDHRFTSWLR